jgi:hypothetical protein
MHRGDERDQEQRRQRESIPGSNQASAAVVKAGQHVTGWGVEDGRIVEGRLQQREEEAKRYRGHDEENVGQPAKICGAHRRISHLSAW